MGNSTDKELTNSGNFKKSKLTSGADNSEKNNYGDKVYQPCDILQIFINSIKGDEFRKEKIRLEGNLKKTGRNPYNGYYYDELYDKNFQENGTAITVRMPRNYHEEIEDDSYISASGTVYINPKKDGTVKIEAIISSVDNYGSLVFSETEKTRLELHRLKERNGYKNIDNLIVPKLYDGKQPRIALILPEGGITEEDFYVSLGDEAKTDYIIEEFKLNFSNSNAFASKLKELDSKYDIITIMRGGGSGLDSLDNLEILEAIAKLEKAACVYALGHEKEKRGVFMKNYADKVIAVPAAFGTYLRDISREVRENTRKLKDAEERIKLLESQGPNSSNNLVVFALVVLVIIEFIVLLIK